MADTPNPTGNQGQDNQSPPNTPQGTQNEPAWLQHVPEQFREDAKKGYLLQSDYTKKTQEWSEKQKSWDAEKQQLSERLGTYDSWYRDQYTPFYQKAQPHMEKIMAIINGQQQQSPVQNGNGQGQSPFDNYDVLPPQEQARRVAEYNKAEFLNMLNEREQRMNQEWAKREQYYSNLLSVMNNAWSKKFQNPNLDMDAFMKEALAYQAGQKNPFDAAYASVTKDADLKALQEQFYKKGREDMELEIKNRQQVPGAMQSETIPLFKQKPKTRDEVTEAARQQAIKAGLPW